MMTIVTRARRWGSLALLMMGGVLLALAPISVLAATTPQQCDNVPKYYCTQVDYTNNGGNSYTINDRKFKRGSR